MDRRPDPQYEGNPAASFSTIFRDDEESSSLDESSDFSATALGYINQMLMEEDMEENYNLFQDTLALQQAEKSFYDVIGQKYPPPPPSSSIEFQHHHHDYPSVESPEQSLSGSGSFGDYSFSSTGSCATTSNPELDPIDYNPLLLPTTFPTPPPNFVFQSNSSNPITQSPTSHPSYFTTTTNTGSMWLDSTLLTNSEYLLQFERGVEQGSQFLPRQTPFIVDPPHIHNATLFPSFRNAPPQVVIKTESPEEEHFLAVSQGRQIGEQEDEDEDEVQDGRSSKQPEVNVDESELSELFDKLLLTGHGKAEESSSSGGGKSSAIRRQGNYYEQVVDLRTLLMLCAQAISSDDRSTANQLLKQIKQHSSSTGGGTQRMAYFFGNALEARLAGTGSRIYRALSTKKNSAADMIRAYQVYNLACPFEKLAIIFANNAIWNLAKEAETLHIIDFGINYGFKWPAFINRISKRAGGPPKLRITGIEFPRPGFRILQRLQETGRRLASYCSRFNVPFEFDAIVQRWETIKVEDLKIRQNELVAVNCLFRFENLLDETVVLENPRDAVLDLIKKANPNIFVHGIVNGCYDAPFFVTRFREALFHYSALFDVLDTSVAREDPMRLVFEEEIWGREVMNVIACEGCERVERPETYKQWQLRLMRGGFRQLTLDHQIINKLRVRLREDAYNSDFGLEVDDNWVLQGWKGRILYASSCWAPA